MFLERGWQLYPKPTSGQAPGTVFRIDAARMRYPVGRPEVSTAVAKEAFGRHRESVRAEAGTLAELLGIASLRVRSSAIETLSVELDGVQRESLSDADWDRVKDDFFKNLELRPDSTYYVIRETRRARRISYELGRKTIDDLGGEVRVTQEAKASGKAFVAERDNAFVLRNDFSPAMRVMYLAESIRQPKVLPPSKDARTPLSQPDHPPASELAAAHSEAAPRDDVSSAENAKAAAPSIFEDVQLFAVGSEGPIWSGTDPRTMQRSLIKRVHRQPPIDQRLLDRIISAYSRGGADLDVILPDRIERDGPNVFEILPFVDGWNLTEAMSYDRGNSASGKLLEEWLLDLASSLAIIHREGIVHRDISPANILLRADNLNPTFVDFTRASLAGTDQVPFASPYVAPDAMRGAATLASDIYSLGGVFLFLLTHRDPPSPEQLARTQAPLLGPEEKRVLREVLPRMLEPNPEARLPDADHVVQYMTRKRHGTDLADYSVRARLRLPDGRTIAMAKHTYRVVGAGEPVPAEVMPA